MNGSDAGRPPAPGAQLEADDVISYLMGLRELTAAELVHSAFWVEQLDRRNVSYVVHTDRPRYFLKRARNAWDNGLPAEAAAYRALRGTSVGSYLPALVSDESTPHILTLQHLGDVRTLREFHQTTGRAPAYLGREVGRMLAALHQSVVTLAAEDRAETAPWALTLLNPPLSVLQTESSGTLEVLRRIQGDPRLMSTLDEVLAGWRVTALCHNDMRLDNLLLTPDRRLAVVDWELCAPGDAAWDVAGFIEGYLELWLTGAVSRSQRGTARAGPGTDVPARRSLTVYRPLLRGFWEAYGAARLPYGLAEPVSAPRTARLVGVRLLQAALEYSQLSNDITSESLALEETAKSFVLQPLECWVHLLQLPLSDRGKFGD